MIGSQIAACQAHPEPGAFRRHKAHSLLAVSGIMAASRTPTFGEHSMDAGWFTDHGAEIVVGLVVIVIAALVGAAGERARAVYATHVRRRRLCSFFGEEAAERSGVAVCVNVQHSLTTDATDDGAPVTRVRKVRWDAAKGELHEDLRPIYGRVVHLDDYLAYEEV